MIFIPELCASNGYEIQLHAQAYIIPWSLDEMVPVPGTIIAKTGQ
jgi:hypothetical protein